MNAEHQEREGAWNRMIETGRRIGNDEGRWELFREFLKTDNVPQEVKAVFAEWWLERAADRLSLRVPTNPNTYELRGEVL